MKPKSRLKELQRRWEVRINEVFARGPLDGIYCVYSMYWRQLDEKPGDKGRASTEGGSC